MIELVFNESARGCIRHAQVMGRNYSGGSCAAVGILGGKGDIGEKLSAVEKQMKDEAELCKNSVPLPKNEVLSIAPALSVGYIVKNTFWEQRGEVYCALYHEHSAAEFIQRNKKSTEKLKEYAKTADKIRIWTEHTPDSMCALLFAAGMIKDTGAEVSFVPLPVITASGAFLRGWGEMLPYKLSETAAERERPITGEQLKSMAYEWDRLCAENTPLRAVINGRVCSVNEDLYDKIILEHIPNEPVLMGKTIACIIERFNISDAFIAYRIREMIKDGIIETAREGDRIYGNEIRRVL